MCVFFLPYYISILLYYIGNFSYIIFIGVQLRVGLVKKVGKKVGKRLVYLEINSYLYIGRVCLRF
jgi:hypothetical protein